MFTYAECPGKENLSSGLNATMKHNNPFTKIYRWLLVVVLVLLGVFGGLS